MGIFTRNYNKPGPGVFKTDPEKKPFFKFWDLLGRKLTRHIVLNMLYFLILLPVIVFIYVSLYVYVYYNAGVDIDTVALTPLMELCINIYTIIPAFLHMPLVVLSALMYGPITMGHTYILRNFAREEHAWTSDLFVRALKNWKQGLFFGILDIVIVFVVGFNLGNGYLWGTDSLGLLGEVIRWLSLIGGIFYIFMRNYNYMQAVSIELGALQILRNSAIFGVLGLLRNVIATISIIAVLVVSFLLYPLIELAMVPFIMFSLCGFIAVFCTYPILNKHVIEPSLAAKSADEGLSGDELVLPPELGGPGAGALEPMSSDGNELEEPDEDE